MVSDPETWGGIGVIGQIYCKKIRNLASDLGRCDTGGGGANRNRTVGSHLVDREGKTSMKRRRKQNDNEVNITDDCVSDAQLYSKFNGAQT